MNLPAKLPDSAITVLIDSRELKPLVFPTMNTKTIALPTADYSIEGLQHAVAIERKGSIEELCTCVGRERARFEREMQRLMGYSTRALVIETDWATIEAGKWRSKLVPGHIIGSLNSWVTMGIPVVLTGNRQRAETIVTDLLRKAANHHYRQLRQFANQLEAS